MLGAIVTAIGVVSGLITIGYAVADAIRHVKQKSNRPDQG